MVPSRCPLLYRPDLGALWERAFVAFDVAVERDERCGLRVRRDAVVP